jgi:transposase
MALHIGVVTEEERGKVERLTRARSAPIRLVTRARMVQLAIEGLTAPAIARELGVSEKIVRIWLKRFAQAGIAGLDDARRSGRPRTYTEDVYSQVVARARGLPPKPAVKDEEEVAPTCHWTLDRLQSELAKDGLPIKRSQIRRILRVEHIKWQKPRTWLESDDPEFAQKRGPSSRSTPRHRKAAR